MRNGFEDLELDELWRRRSEKWQKYPPGVLPAFVAEIHRLFNAEEIREYLKHLEHTKYFVETDLDLDDPDEDEEVADEPWPENPVGGAEELLRFFRVRELLQA